MKIKKVRLVCDLCGRELNGKTGMQQIELVNPREDRTEWFDLCGMCYEDVLFWKGKRKALREEEED